MKLLVTGADGFVGQWLVQAALDAGHQVIGAVRGGRPMAGRLQPGEVARVRWVPLDLETEASIAALGAEDAEAVLHLAAVASSVEAGKDPGQAWAVNATGTARLAEAVAAEGRRLLVVSTAEVYGPGPARPRRETDPIAPLTPYAASKAAAEVAALEVGRRTGLAVIIARPFPHTGPGQSTTFVAPAFLERIRAARRSGAATVRTGNLDPVRELLDVRDVAAAYLALIAGGRAGETYNVARGEGLTIAALFERLAALTGGAIRAETDPDLRRPSDIPHLVGDPTKLTTETGWRPTRSLDQTLRDLVDAQAH